MSKYRVKERSFIDGKLYEPGEVVEFSGKAGKNLIPHKEGDVAAAEEKPQSSEELEELDQLRTTYEEMFGEKPHFNTKAETIREKIAEERQRLGV